MVWEPFLLAIGFGVAVSAAIYFALLWPQVEPLDDDEVAALGGEEAVAAAAATPGTTTADNDAAGESASDAVS